MKKKRIIILMISLKQCFVEKKKQGDKSICKKLLNFFIMLNSESHPLTRILSNLEPLSRCLDRLLAPLIISLHLPLSTIGFSFVSSSHNGSGTKVFSNVGQFIKTLPVFVETLYGYIYTLNQWFSKIK
jgi:hypothetical protein